MKNSSSLATTGLMEETQSKMIELVGIDSKRAEVMRRDSMV
jgi:hypothetical protein